MKGVVVERALPGNVLDVYALFKSAVKEGCVTYPKITEKDLSGFYFELTEALKNPNEFIFLARKGRQFLGYTHAKLVFGRFDKKPMAIWDMVYVIPKSRKLGVGKQLSDVLFDTVKSTGISTVDFLCHDELVSFWEKKVKAKKVLNYMTVEL